MCYFVAIANNIPNKIMSRINPKAKPMMNISAHNPKLIGKIQTNRNPVK